MKTNKHEHAFRQKRRTLMVLPLLLVPFITLGFWALGGGNTEPTNTIANTEKGLNLQLPDATLKEDKQLNKLSFYEMAAADSAKLLELIRNDPYFNIDKLEGESKLGDSSEESLLKTNPFGNSQTTNAEIINKKGPEVNEEKILKKLKQLNKELDNSVLANKPVEEPTNDISKERPKHFEENKSIDNVETQQELEDEPVKDNNPELNQLNGMLEKILDIQHPDRIKDKIKQASKEKQELVFPIVNMEYSSPITLLENPSNKHRDSAQKKKSNIPSHVFYGLSENNPIEEQEQNTVKAIVHENQTIVSGSIVKLRSLNDIYLNGILIPKMHFIYGTAFLSEERLKIEIKSIRFNNHILPVNLRVYDLDGMEGLYIPGAIARYSAKESSDKALQSIALNSIDPSVGTQAASLGIEAAKSFLSKKVKLIKVTLKPGYQVLLKESSNK